MLYKRERVGLMRRFENKVCIVTGSSGGLGAADCIQFAKEGGKVVVSDIDEAGGEQVVAELKTLDAEAVFIKADATSEEDVQNLIDKTVEIFGKLDVFVANAGISIEADVHEIPFKDWQKIIDVNLTGVYLADKFAVAQFLKQGTGGAIVNIGSIHSFVARKGLTSYSASKGGVLMLTKMVGATYANKGIRCNAVCPGYIRTRLTDTIPPEIIPTLVNLHPMGRLGKPHEVAKTVAFLASDDASFITGTSILVDGGYSAV